MEEIITLLEKSIENFRLETSEKKELKAKIKEANFNKRERDFLRSKIFDIAIANQHLLSKPELIDWIEECNKLSLPSKVHQSGNYAFFSPGNSCRSAIVSKMKAAKNSLKVCVFTISDNEIRDEILIAHKRGIAIKIISDNDKSFDAGSDIDFLSKKGIQIKIDQTTNHMHHKFCIVDNEVLITGSYNWTRSAAERNQENIVISQDHTLLKSFIKEFDQLWHHMVDY